MGVSSTLRATRNEVKVSFLAQFPHGPARPLPHGRPRRLRRDEFTRNLVREHAVSVNDLIYPVFVLEGQGRREAVASMPGVERLSLDLPVAEDCVKLGIPVMALFPVISASPKTRWAARPPTPTAWCPPWCARQRRSSPAWA